MVVCGNVYGDKKYDFFHAMGWYILRMKNFEKVCEIYNKGTDFILPKLQDIKYMGVAFNINKLPQVCVGMLYGFKRSDSVVTPSWCGSEDDLILKLSINIFLISILTGYKRHYTHKSQSPPVWHTG